MKGLIDYTGSLFGIPDFIYEYGTIHDSNPLAVDLPDDFSYDKYTYTPAVSGVYDPNGFALVQQAPTIDYIKRQENVAAMNGYMASFVSLGQLTQANFDLFLSDTAALATQYIGGGGRLITWIETVNRNGFNATTTGFKTKTAYRGTLVNGLYPRAENIILILNDL